jgi:hypothetical protein
MRYGQAGIAAALAGFDAPGRSENPGLARALVGAHVAGLCADPGHHAVQGHVELDQRDAGPAGLEARQAVLRARLRAAVDEELPACPQALVAGGDAVVLGHWVEGWLGSACLLGHERGQTGCEHGGQDFTALGLGRHWGHGQAPSRVTQERSTWVRSMSALLTTASATQIDSRVSPGDRYQPFFGPSLRTSLSTVKVVRSKCPAILTWAAP